MKVLRLDLIVGGIDNVEQMYKRPKIPTFSMIKEIIDSSKPDLLLSQMYWKLVMRE